MHLILSSFSTSEDKSACQRKLSKKISGIIKIESSGKNRIQYVQNNKIFLTTNIQKSMLRTTKKNPEKYIQSYVMKIEESEITKYS